MAERATCSAYENSFFFFFKSIHTLANSKVISGRIVFLQMFKFIIVYLCFMLLGLIYNEQIEQNWYISVKLVHVIFNLFNLCRCHFGIFLSLPLIFFPLNSEI